MYEDNKTAKFPTVMVWQPATAKLLEPGAKDDLVSWERRIAEWSGVRFEADDILSSGGTCTDSGNDCDVD